MNWHDEHKDKSSLLDHFTDIVATFAGSWFFIVLHAIWFGSWVLFRVETYPFGLLTLIVSLEAIFLSTFVMMNQNRSGDRDRANAQADYDTNKKAKEEIELLQKALYRLESETLDAMDEKLDLIMDHLAIHTE